MSSSRRRGRGAVDHSEAWWRKVATQADAAQPLTVGEYGDGVAPACGDVAWICKTQKRSGIDRDRPGAKGRPRADKRTQHTDTRGSGIPVDDGAQRVGVGAASQEQGRRAIFIEQTARNSATEHGTIGESYYCINVVAVVPKSGAAVHIDGVQSESHAIAHRAARGTGGGAEVGESEALEGLERNVVSRLRADVPVGGGGAINSGVGVDVNIAIERRQRAAKTVRQDGEAAGAEAGIDVELATVEDNGLITHGAHSGTGEAVERVLEVKTARV